MALRGVRVLEMAGLAPVPFAGMMLADFGADVIRVDSVRPGVVPDPLCRGKRSVQLDVKDDAGRELFWRLLKTADVLIEPYRPGVMERLGLGPDEALRRQPQLIYARLTGWGQTGSLKKTAGHDINYLALSGMLHAVRRKGDAPLAPGNILGDFAGGGMLCVVGILMALLERQHSGRGQVIDAAMLDGAAYLSTFVHKMKDLGVWSAPPGENLLDSGAAFYDTYETSDGKYMAVGAIEGKFYRQLIAGLGLQDAHLPDFHMDAAAWPTLRDAFRKAFASKPQAHWTAVFDGTDACVTPVLSMDDMMAHPHNAERQVLRKGVDGELEPAPAPRLSRSPALPSRAMPAMGGHTRELLREIGVSDARIDELLAAGSVACAEEEKDAVRAEGASADGIVLPRAKL
eukprot:PLAT5163.1.p1 GENE.PLAT5163.1~~PLAT5163.1.p1  ORF type:complete len:401 (-),score=94.58 PLAT5163.1:34-1236(-)